MPDRRFSLSHLLAPMDARMFTSRFFGQRPAHIKGHSRKFEALFSWQRLNRMLDSTSLWNAPRLRVVREHQPLAPQAFSRPASDETAGTVLRAVPARVARLLAEGATINLNEVEKFDEHLAAVSATFAMAFTCRSNCNLYLSRKEVAAFASHFDPTDVFVLHIDGRKRWRIYERPFEAPAYVDGYHNGSFPDAYHEANKGPVLLEPTLEPGDLLYIPAGYYHDALALTDMSLHLTFSIELVRGLVLAEILTPLLASEPLFRRPLPGPDDTAAHDAHIGRLAERMAALLRSPQVTAHIRERQKNQAFWDVPRYTLPLTELEQIFRVRNLAATFKRSAGAGVLRIDGAEHAFEAAQVPVVDWILEVESFCAAELLRTFEATPRAVVQSTLERLAAAGAIEPIDPFTT